MNAPVLAALDDVDVPALDGHVLVGVVDGNGADLREAIGQALGEHRGHVLGEDQGRGERARQAADQAFDDRRASGAGADDDELILAFGEIGGGGGSRWELLLASLADGAELGDHLAAQGLFVGDVLGDHVGGAEAHGFEGVGAAGGGEGGAHEHGGSQFGAQGAQARQHAQAVHHGHLDVQRHHVGRERLDLFECLLPVPRAVDHLHHPVGLDELGEHAADHDRIVDDQYSHG